MVNSLFNDKLNVHTIYNILLKVFGMIFTFFVIPLILKLLGKNDYGIWLTLSSFAAWFNYLDAGLGNGLRNKLSTALANGNRILAQEYVSTTYAIFFIIMTSFFLFSIPIVFLINWTNLLNTQISLDVIIFVVLFMFASTCTRLILDLACTIFLSVEKSYMKLGSDFLISLFSFIVVFFFPKDISNKFLNFSIIFSCIPIFVLVALNFYLFKRNSQFNYLMPQFNKICKSHIRGIFNLSLNFFFIQLIGIIIFSTDNLLIAYFFSPAAVTSFNIAFKYFSISTMLFSIIMLPYWTAFTKAHVNEDISWIKTSFKKLYIIWFIQILFVIVQIFASAYFYKIWVGDKIIISFPITIALGVYTIIFNWNNIFAYFLNGVSKIKLQLYSAFFVGIVNLPLTYILIKYGNFGPLAIIIANTICLLISAIWSPIQSYKILNNTAKGIWNK